MSDTDLKDLLEAASEEGEVKPAKPHLNINQQVFKKFTDHVDIFLKDLGVVNDFKSKVHFSKIMLSYLKWCKMNNRKAINYRNLSIVLGQKLYRVTPGSRTFYINPKPFIISDEEANELQKLYDKQLVLKKNQRTRPTWPGRNKDQKETK